MVGATEGPRSISFEHIADDYDATRGGLRRGASMADGVAPHVVGSGPVLEIGVGTGAVALPLRERGVDVVGVDLSPAMLARAHERLGSRVAVGDGLHLPVGTASVGAAYCVWVLQLVADIGELLAEVARVLRPGGRFVVVRSTPVMRPDEFTEIEGDVHLELRPPRDTPELVEPLAGRHGLVVVHVGATDEQEWEQSPEEVVDRYERRAYSTLWDIDPARFETLVAPVVRRLRTLPDAARPRVRASRHPLFVLERE